MPFEKSKQSKPARLRWYDHIIIRILPPLAASLVKLLMLSCRVIKVEGETAYRKVLGETGGNTIYPTWHQRMPYLFHYFGSQHVTVMISQSRDGEYVTRMATWLGFKNVRGSSTRGGMEALKDMRYRLLEGESGGMLADGPVGPARVAKIGTILLARDTGLPLVPLTWSADRCWVLNSWDRYMIPKPFARIVFQYGEPFYVPKKAKKQDLEAYRKELEDKLNNGCRWCDEHFGEERPWRKVKKKGVPEKGPWTG